MNFISNINEVYTKIKLRINFTNAIGIIFFMGILLRIIHFGNVPDGFLFDEAGSAVDAFNLINYGTDRYGFSFPVYFINYGGGQSALYTYLLSVSIYFFGFNLVAIRLPMLLASIIFGVFGILIVDKIFKNNFLNTNELSSEKVRNIAKVLFVTLWAFSPYPFLVAHVGLDCNLMLTCSTVFLYFLLKAIDTSKLLHFITAGIFGGIVLYSYAISYIVMPLFLLILSVYLLWTKNIRKKNIFTFAFTIFIIALPLILVQYVNYFDKPSMNLFGFTITKLTFYRAGEITFSNLMQNMFLVIKSTLFYDWIDYNTVIKYYTFYPMSIIFFLRGLFYFMGCFIETFHEKRYLSITVIFIWYFSEFVLGMMLGKTDDVGANPNANKLNGIFISIMIIIVLGILVSFRDMAKIRLKKYLAGFTIFLYASFSIAFFKYYYTDHNPKFCVDYVCTDVIDFINKNEEFSNKIIVFDAKAIFLLCSDTNFMSKKNMPLPIREYKDHFYNYYSDRYDVLPKDLPDIAAYIIHDYKKEIIEKYAAENYKIIPFKHYVLIYK